MNPKTKQAYRLSRKINLIALAAGIFATLFASCATTKAHTLRHAHTDAHYCPISDCPYLGQVNFLPPKERAENSSQLLMDREHFNYPNLPYSTLDSMVNGCVIYRK